MQGVVLKQKLLRTSPSVPFKRWDVSLSVFSGNIHLSLTHVSHYRFHSSLRNEK